MATDQERRSARIIRLLPLLGVVAITLRLYWNLAKATDLTLADEATYLSAGSRFLYHGVLPPFEELPLYAAWYAAHLAVFRDPIAAYYAQLYAVVVLTAILMYVYLRQIAVSTSLAFVATILWITQPAYIKFDWTIGWPRPYHFAFLLFLAGAIAIRRLKLDCPVPLLLAGASFLLLAMAVRTEYFVALLFFVGLVAVSSRSRSRQLLPTEHRAYLWPVCLLVTAATLTTAIYLKGRVPGETFALANARSWFAFGQQFSVYRLGSPDGAGNLNPWDDWEFIVGQTFPRAHSVLGAALANPRAFLGFELHNLITAPLIIGWYLTRRPYLPLKLSVLCLTAVWLSFVTLTSVSVRRRALFTSAFALGPYVLSGAALAIPGTLITPKIVYFLPLLFVLFVGAVKWLSIVLESDPRPPKSVVALFAVMLSLAFVVIRSPFDNGKGVGKPFYSEMIEIRSILERQRVEGARILQIGGVGYSAYLPYGLSETVQPYDRGDAEHFWDFVRRERIEAILVDDRLRSNRRFRDDSDFALLLRSPERFGWMSAPVGTRGDVFYLRDRRQNSLGQQDQGAVKSKT
jgi:hypothetical protein